MMAHDEQKRLDGKARFMRGDRVDDIAAALDVPARTVYRWMREDAWRAAKKQMRLALPASPADAIRGKIGELCAVPIEDAGKFGDAMAKLMRALTVATALERDPTGRLAAAQDLAGFLTARLAPDALEAVQPVLGEYLESLKAEAMGEL